MQQPWLVTCYLLSSRVNHQLESITHLLQELSSNNQSLPNSEKGVNSFFYFSSPTPCFLETHSTHVSFSKLVNLGITWTYFFYFKNKLQSRSPNHPLPNMHTRMHVRMHNPCASMKGHCHTKYTHDPPRIRKLPSCHINILKLSYISFPFTIWFSIVIIMCVACSIHNSLWSFLYFK